METGSYRTEHRLLPYGPQALTIWTWWSASCDGCWVFWTDPALRNGDASPSVWHNAQLGTCAERSKEGATFITSEIILKRLRWAGCIARMGGGGGFGKKTCRNGELGRPKRRRENNIKGCERNKMGKGAIKSYASGKEQVARPCEQKH